VFSWQSVRTRRA